MCKSSTYGLPERYTIDRLRRERRAYRHPFSATRIRAAHRAAASGGTQRVNGSLADRRATSPAPSPVQRLGPQLQQHSPSRPRAGILRQQRQHQVRHRTRQPPSLRAVRQYARHHLRQVRVVAQDRAGVGLGSHPRGARRDGWRFCGGSVRVIPTTIRATARAISQATTSSTIGEVHASVTAAAVPGLRQGRVGPGVDHGVRRGAVAR